jgi:hypothetical protein
MIGEKVMPTLESSTLALIDTCKILHELQIPFMLDGGTLLGFYRDGTFAVDDHDDIDLTLGSEFWDRDKNTIVEKMLGVGFEVYKIWNRDTHNHYSGQMAFKRNNVKIDLMFKEFDDFKQKIWWTVFGGKRGVTYKSVPSDYLRALVATPIKLLDSQIEVGMPARIKEYLTYRYGNWKVPVHRKDYSCYTTDKCIVEPNNYESI